MELAKCRGTADPYCATCARYDPRAPDTIPPIMTEPGLCFNHVLRKDDAVQSESEDAGTLRVRSVPERGE